MNDQTHCLVKVLILTLCIPPVVQHDCCYYKYIIGVKYNFRPKKLISNQIGWNLNLRSIFMRGITFAKSFGYTMHFVFAKIHL
jgi:hypothetical protein